MKPSILTAFSFFFVGVFALVIFKCGPMSSATLKEEQTLLYRDLALIVDHLRCDHPGWYNSADPSFRQQVEDFSLHIQKSARTSRMSIGGSRGASSRRRCYTNTKVVRAEMNRSLKEMFSDPHLRLDLNEKEWEMPRWWYLESSYESSCSVRPIGQTDVVWITLPTFWFDTEQQKASFDVVLRDAASVSATLPLVFDLRENRGGSSKYGVQLLEVLFGKEYVQYRLDLAAAQEYVDWRASKGNIAHLEGLYEKLGFISLVPIIAGMKKALARGDIYYRECSSPLPEKSMHMQTPASRPIFVITDSMNGSATLDFIDAVFEMECPVVLVGRETMSDRLYMEVRTVVLPSGKGSLTFPIKVYRNRKRGDKVNYVPDYEINALIPFFFDRALASFLQKSLASAD